VPQSQHLRLCQQLVVHSACCRASLPAESKQGNQVLRTACLPQVAMAVTTAFSAWSFLHGHFTLCIQTA